MSKFYVEESKGLKIEKYNFIFYVNFENFNECKCYVPQVNELELKSISRILAYFYKSFKEEDERVVMVDYERFIEESIEPITNEAQRERKKEQLETYFERSFLGASFYDDEWTEIDKTKLTEDDIHNFRATLLFISALFHYSTKEGKNHFLGRYFTSYNVMEWIEHSKKQSEQSIKITENIESNQKQEEPSLFVSVN